jgi:hypothetical protein
MAAKTILNKLPLLGRAVIDLVQDGGKSDPEKNYLTLGSQRSISFRMAAKVIWKKLSHLGIAAVNLVQDGGKSDPDYDEKHRLRNSANMEIVSS